VVYPYFNELILDGIISPDDLPTSQLPGKSVVDEIELRKEAFKPLACYLPLPDLTVPRLLYQGREDPSPTKGGYEVSKQINLMRNLRGYYQ
jgi:hypothetical protein